MQIQYLGTAAAEAFPAVFCHCPVCQEARRFGGKNMRGRSGAIINAGALLIDFPPDIYLASLKFGIDLGSIAHLLITHSHRDHFAVQELMTRDSAYNAHYPEGETPLHIYGNPTVLSALEAAMQQDFGTNNRPSFASHTVEPFQPFFAGDLRIIPLLALHNRREQCLMYIVESDGKRLLYAHDTGYFPEVDWEYIAGMPFDLVSLDCCFGPGRDGGNHMGIPDNIEVKQRMESLHCTTDTTQFILNHFSHNGGLLHEELQAVATPYGFSVAYDGLTITV